MPGDGVTQRNEDLHDLFFAKQYYGHQIEYNVMGRTCSTNWRVSYLEPVGEKNSRKLPTEGTTW